MQSLGIDIIFTSQNLIRLFGGLLVTARIAFISILFSSVLGVLFGLLMTSRLRVIKFICRVYFEIFRILPILVILYLVYFGVTTAFGVHLDGELVAIIVFSLWGMAEMGDIVRGSLESLPKHQIESGKAIGLNSFDLYKFILIPQAIKRMIPGAVNLTTRIIKTTSLVVLIGVVDVLKVGQQIIEVSRFQSNTASFWIYGFIFILYFLMCYPLSVLSKKLETKWSD